jgi:hypothetical protein
MNLVTVHGKLELEARDETAGIVEEGRILSWMCGDERGVLGREFLAFFWCISNCLARFANCSSVAPVFC